ncbi:sce7726 family protein [Ornithinibacillus sp. FSL M8-0202]|uniref:sce7726 family protein n=1 Tax=Ornithinibacillus sp. FSL M8-0202 TaxID=2921616 RepID=UPI0030D0424D
MLLNDSGVRSLLLKELKSQYQNDPDTRIVNELGIQNGQSRIDVAVIKGIIHGFEIKSDYDTLDRLPRQMEYYNKLFQRMTIVSSRKYYKEICEMVPKWWGIKVISSDGTRLIEKRKGRKQTSQDKDVLLGLLWKKDLEDLIDVLGYPKSMKKLKKHQLLEIFSKEADVNIIQQHVYFSLKTRQNWR